MSSKDNTTETLKRLEARVAELEREKDKVEKKPSRKKGVQTEYTKFCKRRRQEMKDAGELEGLTFGDVSKNIAKEWKENNNKA